MTRHTLYISGRVAVLFVTAAMIIVGSAGSALALQQSAKIDINTEARQVTSFSSIR
jgi:hypothetical protein